MIKRHLSKHKLGLLFSLILGGMQPITLAATKDNYQFDLMVPPSTSPWYFQNPSGIAVAPDGSVWIADTGNNRIQHLKADGSVIAKVGTEGTAAGQFSHPIDVKIAKDGSVWVADIGNNRLQHLKADGTFIGQFGAVGTDAEQFGNSEPFRFVSKLALATDGSLWVENDNRIQHLTATGSLISEIKVEDLRSIALAADGSVWALIKPTSDRYRIQHYQADTLITDIESDGDASDLALAADNSVWVTVNGYQNAHFNHFDAQGNSLEKIFRTEVGRTSITLAADGSLWVADADKNNIQHLNKAGEIITQFANLPYSAGSNSLGIVIPEGALKPFNKPLDIISADNNSIWVASAGNNSVQHFSAGGEIIEQIGNNSSVDKQFVFPSGIALTTVGNISVIDGRSCPRCESLFTMNIQYFNPSNVFIR